MERKNEGATRLGICRRLVNIVFQAFRPVNPGRAPSARREETSSLMFDTSVLEEEGEVVLVPPVRTIPVEHRDTKKKPSIAMMANPEEKPEGPRTLLNQDSHEKKKKTIRLRSSSKDDKDKDIIMPKIIPIMGEKDDKTKGKEKEEAFGRSKSPVGRSVSNIDTKFDTFIQDMRKSFEKLS